MKRLHANSRIASFQIRHTTTNLAAWPHSTPFDEIKFGVPNTRKVRKTHFWPQTPQTPPNPGLDPPNPPNPPPDPPKPPHDTPCPAANKCGFSKNIQPKNVTICRSCLRPPQLPNIPPKHPPNHRFDPPNPRLATPPNPGLAHQITKSAKSAKSPESAARMMVCRTTGNQAQTTKHWKTHHKPQTRIPPSTNN